MNEEAAAQQYLVGYLEADAELIGLLRGGVWTRSVSQSTGFPVVKMDREDGEDLRAFGTVGPARVWADLTYLIRGIVHWTGGGHPDWTDVDAIGDRLDTLLHGHAATGTEVEIHVFRDETFTDEAVEDGDLFLQSGGVYRVRARAV